MEKLKILLADDHKIFREGIKSLLSKEKGIDSIVEASNGKEVLSLSSTNHFDVIILDIDMGIPNGIEVTEKLTQANPNSNILILSMLGLPEFIMQAFEAGANGYILKNAGKDEFLTAIKCVAKGDSYFSKEVSISLMKQIQNPFSEKTKKSNIPLSKREVEILKLISQEYSNQEIAAKLFISTRTVDTHRRNLLEKLGIKNNVGLVKYAISKGLID
ncbi:response regulator transcription factor [Saccharicrinis fermentans]|uniref:Nitrogen regulation protein C n=1 Tax=Saccharicrinis fermentans DSM 9555 = JCM 21142 TaxID=869213 RepID=W7XXN7_9BACT|nr:response regulator transcription factor [Saccharicrinis fermentans]GAF03220.1 nitrogen regulation protein C [Saccharicrinis fermentans DSM 9555 = JCM 21142]